MTEIYSIPLGGINYVNIPERLKPIVWLNFIEFRILLAENSQKSM